MTDRQNSLVLVLFVLCVALWLLTAGLPLFILFIYFLFIYLLFIIIIFLFFFILFYSIIFFFVSFVFLLLSSVDSVWHCDKLVGECADGYFAFIWSVACVLSVLPRGVIGRLCTVIWVLLYQIISAVHKATMSQVHMLVFDVQWFHFILLNLKTPRKPASENVVCLCRLLNILANFSNLFLHTGKQCGPRSDCSYRSSLIWVHTVCKNDF